jgi:hypothetical protein
MQLGSMFIINCNNTLHVDGFCRSHRPWTLLLDTSPHLMSHQRLSLQFLSAPEDGRKYRPKHVEYYCS